MSYVGEISATQQTAQWMNTTQTAAVNADAPRFADLLAAEMNARMMRAAASDDAEDETDFSGIAQFMLADTLLGMDMGAASAAGQTQADPNPEDTASADAIYVSDVGELQGFADITPDTGIAITNVYAGPSLSVYTDPTDAYSQFTITNVYGGRSDAQMQAAREMAADFAVSREGDPYSQSKRGQDNYVDCSYLTKWAYRQVGVSLPATAAEQARYCVNNGYEIPSSELQRGDLIFWQKKGCTCGRYDEIHHVAIYLGDGKIVEASSSRGQVVINSMWGDDGVGSWQIAMCARPS